MMLVKTKHYKKHATLLPKKDAILLAVQEKLLLTDIFHPKLHTKKLKGFSNPYVYSFRITRGYRGLFRMEAETVILFAIGHRKDIYDGLE